MNVEKLYNKERDTDGYDNLVMKHMMAMTAEDLHSKAAIAVELAYRDKCIAELEYWKDCGQVSLQMKIGKIQALEERIAQLEQALRDIKEWTDRYTAPGHPISTFARKALEETK